MNARSDPPNVLLIVIDAARADHFSCFGYPRPTTPFLDQLTRRSAARFTRAYSAAPWTVPAFASLFTGQFPSRHGARRAHPILDCAFPTLAETLARLGYETFGVSNSSWISNATRYDRGFQTFVKVWQLFQDSVDVANAHLRAEFSDEQARPAWRGMLATLRAGNPLKNAINTVYGRYAYKRRDYGAARVNASVRRWLRRRRPDRPFFAFVYYLEPHLRYRPPPAFAEKFLPPGVRYADARRVNQDAWAYMAGRVPMGPRDFELLTVLYDGEIAYTDFRLRELFADFEAAGVLEDTLVFITADHGENLGEHGMMDHQYGLYDTLLHVPLIVRYPPRFPGGAEYSTLAQSLDIFPTVLDVIGLNVPEVRSQLAGQSLLPEQLAERRPYALAEYPDPQPRIQLMRRRYPGFDGSQWDRGLQALRTERWKLVRGTDGRADLFDLWADPGENEDVSAAQPRVLAELQTLLDKELGPILPHAPSNDGMPLDAEVLRRLEALGYLS